MTERTENRLLTVIMPNHNYAPFVAAAIESVARQDYAPIEIIVVDDASTDDSVTHIEAALAGASSLARTKFIHLDNNVGKLGAINRAIPEMRGELCIILDSDDILLDGYVSRCVAELDVAHAADERIGFVYTNCQLIDDDDNHLEYGQSTPFDPALIEKYSFIPQPAVVFSRAIVEASPYDEEVRKGTKHHQYKRMIKNGWWAHHVAEPLFAYRMHKGNLSGIGKRVTDEVESGEGGERILSGYWPLETKGPVNPY